MWEWRRRIDAPGHLGIRWQPHVDGNANKGGGLGRQTSFCFRKPGLRRGASGLVAAALGEAGNVAAHMPAHPGASPMLRVCFDRRYRHQEHGRQQVERQESGLRSNHNGRSCMGGASAFWQVSGQPNRR